MARLPTGGVLAFVILLLFVTTEVQCEDGYIKLGGRHRRQNRPAKSPHLLNDHVTHRKRAVINGSACIEAAPAEISAPKRNVWKQLDAREVHEVTAWLYRQPELNLTRGYGPHNNNLYDVELMLPNKTDVLAYFDGNGTAPARYARCELYLNSKEVGHATYKDILVGPLPVSRNTTKWQSLGYPYTRKSGSIRDSDAHFEEIYKWTEKIGRSVKDIYEDFFPQIKPREFYWDSSTPYQQDENGTLGSWFSLWSENSRTRFDTGTLLPLNLYFGVQWTYLDPKQRSFLGWLYDDVWYPTTEDFRSAYNNGSLRRFPAAITGQWADSGHQGKILPLDTKPPPRAIAPSGSRFSWDEEAKYIQWMGFTFYLGFTPNRGLAFYDIRHKGQRVIYELSFQEALAHYAGTDPVQSTTSYLDASYDLGADAVELVAGYDCPAYAKYMDIHPFPGSSSITKNAICFFEFDADYPMARHTSYDYTSNTKNILFVVRAVYTVGNYDYMFSHEFYLDGSIKISVRASGYIQGQYYAGNHEYGYHIHDALSGSMHDHVLNFKADFDVLGTANTMQLTSFVPVDAKYPWSEKPRKTFKLNREFIESEDTSRLIWDRATQYRIVNTDTPNRLGEYRGYRILPADATTHFTNNESSNLANCIHPFTFDIAVTKQKDTEPQSTHPNDSNDIHNPMVNFDTFFNGESLVQEDLVVWFNLGMHHLPHTGDLPNTVFTIAHAGVQMMPLNYYQDDISTETLSQVQINYKYSGNVTKVKTFGQQDALCSIDLSKEAPDLYQYDYGY